MIDWKPLERWLYGLGAACIGGGAGAVTSSFSAALLDPATFNLQTGTPMLLKLMGTTFVVNAVLAAFFYLKSAPLPQWDLDRDGDRRAGAGDRSSFV